MYWHIGVLNLMGMYICTAENTDEDYVNIDVETNVKEKL